MHHQPEVRFLAKISRTLAGWMSLENSSLRFGLREWCSYWAQSRCTLDIHSNRGEPCTGSRMWMTQQIPPSVNLGPHQAWYQLVSQSQLTLYFNRLTAAHLPAHDPTLLSHFLTLFLVLLPSFVVSPLAPLPWQATSCAWALLLLSALIVVQKTDCPNNRFASVQCKASSGASCAFGANLRPKNRPPEQQFCERPMQSFLGRFLCFRR